MSCGSLSTDAFENPTALITCRVGVDGSSAAFSETASTADYRRTRRGKKSKSHGEDFAAITYADLGQLAAVEERLDRKLREVEGRMGYIHELVAELFDWVHEV